MARADLAGASLALAGLIADAAIEAPGMLPEDDPLSRTDEAGTLLGELLATTREGTGEQRWLCTLSAYVVEFDRMLLEDPEAGDLAIDFLERAAVLTPPSPWSGAGAGDDALWWHAGRAAMARVKLALCLWDRYALADGPVSDRDHVIVLLSPSAVGTAAQDTNGSAGVFEVESDDPYHTQACRQACLGLALADRSLDPTAPEEDRRADRSAAVALLQAAHESDELDDDLREDLAFSLAATRYDARDWESDTSTAADLDGIIDLLTPLVSDPEGAGARAVDMCVIVAQDLHGHDGDVARERSAIDWLRLAIGHPAVDEPELRGYRCDLAILLRDRADRNRAEQAEGEPTSADDLAEVSEQLELALAATELPLDPDETRAERDEERLMLAMALFDCLYPEDLQAVQDDALNRLIALGDLVMAGTSPAEDYRGELHLKLGCVLHSRALRRLEPSVFLMVEIQTRGGTPGPETSLSALGPDGVRDLDRAIELLRNGLGLHDYDDDSYILGVQVLAYALTISFTVRLPLIDRPVLEECLRWHRIALDRPAPETSVTGGELWLALVYALMWSVWSNPPLVEGRARLGRDGAILPSVTGYSGAEDDLQLLSQLLDEALTESEECDEAYIVMAVCVSLLRDGDLSDSETCREWLRQLMASVSRSTDSRDLLPGVVHMFIGAIGLELATRRESDLPLTVAEAFEELHEARKYFPDGHPMRSTIDNALEHGPSAIAKDLGSVLGGLLGVDAPTRRDDPIPAEQPNDPDDDGIDIAAAVFVGDGRDYPFADPPLRVLEVIEATAGDVHTDPGARPVAAALVGLARYDRWLRERDGFDLGEAIRLVRGAAIGCGGIRPMLGDRLEALFAGMVLDRYLLLGDRVDLETARSVQDRLVQRTASSAEHPDLIDLLIQEGAADGLPDVAGLFHAVPPVRRTFRAETLAAAGSSALVAVASAGQHGAHIAAEETTIAAGRLRQAVRSLPADHPGAPAARGELAWLDFQQARRSGDAAELRRTVREVVDAATQCPASHPHLPALLQRAASAAVIGEAAEPAQTSSVDEVVVHLEAATVYSGRGYYGARARCQYGLGSLLLDRFRRRGRADDGDLGRAIAVLESARLASNASQGDPFAVILLRTLALAYRACGPGQPDRLRASRDTGRSVLSAHGRAVLLQSGTRRSLGVARLAGRDMLRLVRWCLADGRPEAALDALELGRGLALQAATVAATVPGLLRAAGYQGLAQEWMRFTAPGADGGSGSGVEADLGAGTGSGIETGLQADSEGPAAWHAVPGDVRRRVLEALEGTTAERRLLSAPSPTDVGRALKTLGVDALVHLIPGTATEPGHALIVTASGEVEQLALRGLVRRSGDPLDQYLESFDRYRSLNREAGSDVQTEAAKERDATATIQWRGRVERLCVWAGPAVMTELLAHTRSWGMERVPRLVLAPIGSLGVVPWHAAHVHGPSAGSRTGVRVACQDAVISYCATSRQLVDVAGRTCLPLDGMQVLLVDPHGSTVMHEEAARIRVGFYPASVVIGDIPWTSEDEDTIPESGRLPALAANVEPYLPGRGLTSAAVFVANCHAVSGAVSSDSRLVLDHAFAKDPDRLVTVDRLLSGGAARDPNAPGGLFLLANCGSDLAVADHDEAMTITTAVLAAGAASVVGSRWPVIDDVRTMVLMYMFHHFLSGQGDAGSESGPEARSATGSPADALRAAQLWMIDPERALPPAIADVLPRLSGLALDDPEIWAAFAHHGY